MTNKLPIFLVPSSDLPVLCGDNLNSDAEEKTNQLEETLRFLTHREGY